MSDDWLGRCGICGEPLSTIHSCGGTPTYPGAYPPAYYSGRIAKLEADLADARAEAARLRDLEDAAANILQTVQKISPVEVREWLESVELPQ